MTMLDFSSQDLRFSISGIRGIIGRGLTASSLVKFVQGFGLYLPSGPVIVARDARPTGEMVSRLVIATLQFCGHPVIDLGLVPTPTVGLNIRRLGAVGAINVTASHNPIEWNALKFFNQEGLFLAEHELQPLQELFDHPAPPLLWDQCGTYSCDDQALERHIQRVLDHVNVEHIQSHRWRVVVDGCHSVGGPAVTMLLRKLECEVFELGCEPDGQFSRGLEPVPENLEELCDLVKHHGADFGIAVDPDADRVAFVDNNGRPIGEELSLVLAAEQVLSKKHGQGVLVANLSTTGLVDEVALRHQATVQRTKIGESHVVTEMLAQHAQIGGEGNGGVIFPKVHYGRDALSGVGLLLELLSEREGPLAHVVDQFPPVCMVKGKVVFSRHPDQQFYQKLGEQLRAREVDLTDGAKYILDDGWVHVRSSNTEPIVRVIAEGPSSEFAQKLVSEVSEILKQLD